MKFTAQQIAEALSGKVDGDQMAEVGNFAKIEDGKAGDISFLSNPKYTSYLYTTNATIVIVSEDFVADKEINSTLIRVKDPYAAFATLLDFYYKSLPVPKGISKQATIASMVKICDDVFIDDFVVIGDSVIIGNNARIYSHVSIAANSKIGSETIINSGVRIYSDTKIGSNCTIHSGTIIGSDGFGFAPQAGSDYIKIPQIGNVIIEDWVEIGANTTIDRATMGSTILRKGVKIDNLIQIAHNVEIGENTVIAAQTGISGSTKIGRNCMIGGQVGVIGHLVIADGVKIAAQSGIGKSIKEENAIVEGSPAVNIRDFQRSYVHFRRLDKLVKRIDEIERSQKNK